MARRPDARLIIDSTRGSADLFYLTRFRAPDPVIWLESGGATILILSDLEIDRGRRTARASRCLPLSPLARLARRRLGRSPTAGDVAAVALSDMGVVSVEVPASFPAAHYLALREAGLDVRVAAGPFVPRRRRKTRAEVAEMRRCQRAGEEGITLAASMIAKARPRGRRLLLEGSPLTSERVKRAVTLLLMEKGLQAAGLIVAGSPEQTSMPHDTGSGPLRPDQPIILDFFPRSLSSGYHGDETRTVVRGKPSPRIAAMMAAVTEAELRGARMLGPGARGAEIHARVEEFMTREGFPTSRGGKHPSGFFHGLGHGLGLEIHEPPSLSHPETVLEEGDVVTMEPGLYYPRLGGVRHENLYHVVKGGAEPLSSLDLPFVLR